ncbi:ZFHX4 [Mytilus coruscus]|uniref:ZFHX4 n=1 Tax=Mytilus coruscus TaxID=42192 RepID=A0A6J8EXK1_MYTCO|nr:ZFHX4 [Mytilus coruscus]
MERERGYSIKINICPEVVLKSMPGIGDAIGNRIMDMRKKGINIDRDVLEQIPNLRVTEGLISMIDFGSSPSRENAGAGHPSIPVVDRDRQTTPIFSPLCVDIHEDIRDAPLRRVCSDPDVGRSEAYGDTPYFRPFPVHQQKENKHQIADMCNFGNKVSNWIEEHHANKATTHTGCYESKSYLKSIEQPDFRRTISPIAMQLVLESEIEKVSGEIESLLSELGHLSDVSGRDSLTPSPRTNMVVQHQQEQQNFADSLQRQQVLDLTTHSHYSRQHLNVENHQVPPVANFQQIDQQGINRPQPVDNSHQQDILPVTTNEMPK